MMTGLFLFERRRFWKSKKTLVVILLLLIALASFIMFNTVQDKRYWILQATNLTIERVVIETEIKSVENELSLLEESNQDNLAIQGKEEELDFLTQRRLFNIQQVNHAKSPAKDKAMERTELWLKSDRHLLSGAEAGLDLEHMGVHISIPEIQQRILVSEYLIQQKIQPLNSPYEMTATNFAFKLLDYPWNIIVLLALVLLNIDIFSGDFDGGAYQILYSRSFSRRQIYDVKFLVRAVYSMLIIIGIVAVIFFLVGMTNQFGEFSYPVQYMPSFHQLEAIDSQILLPWTEYFHRAVPLLLVFCSFIIVLTGFISLLTRDTPATLSIISGILFLDFSFRTVFRSESKIFAFWPLAPGVISDVLQGAYSLSAMAYLILLVIATLTLLTVGLVFILKVDLRGGYGN